VTGQEQDFGGPIANWAGMAVGGGGFGPLVG
jgi:hypothetical protein